MRTGKYKYFEFGENVARHIMDVDTVHYNTVANDSRLKGVIPDDFSRVGSQHRHNADQWGGRNDETSHTNLHGILMYYFMTGNERAFDVAKEMASFFLDERVTYHGHPENCPQRNIANLVWGLIEMYETTGVKRYKHVADRWAKVLIDGQRKDGSWLDKYNPMTKKWEGNPKVLFTAQYTLPTLIAYHQITEDPDVAEAIVQGTNYFMNNKAGNPLFDAYLYSYYLTEDVRYLKESKDRMVYFLQRQDKSKKSLRDGMIYQKLYYLRPIEFLYQIPYVFEALALEKTISQRRKAQ